MTGKMWDVENLAEVDDMKRKLEEAGLLDLYRENTVRLQPEYFKNPDGIHGILHARRVLFLSLALAFCMKIEDTDILVTAALYHDIGRQTDYKDFVHGKMSFEKAVKLGLVDENGGEETEILRYLMEQHCIEDRSAFENIDCYDIENRKRALMLLKVFKDADGLDRVRIGDLDTKYLRTEAAKGLVTLAHQLYRRIECI